MNVDRDVEKVLGGIAGAEAPAGLEGRVLARLGEAERRRGGRAGAGWMRVAAAACAVALVAAAWVSVTARHRAPGTPTQANQASAGHPAVGEVRGPGHEAAGSFASRRHDLPNKAVGSPRSLAPQNEVPHPRERQANGGAREGSIAPGEQAMTAEERLAWEEMRAPSMPEQPHGLTKDERMLVQVANSKAAPAVAANSLDTKARLREGTAELGQWMLAGMRVEGEKGFPAKTTE